MFKIKKYHISNIKSYSKDNAFKFVLIIILYLVLTILSNLPYVGLVVSNTFIIISLWVIAIALLNVPSRITALVSITFLIISVLLLQFGLYNNAVIVSELMFLFFIISFVQEFITFIRLDEKI